MCPKIVSIGPIDIYSYGLMLALSFLAARYILNQEFNRRKVVPNLSDNITIIAMVAGVAGAKIFSVLENFDVFLKDPIGIFFNPAGLTFYGGLILAAIAIYYYVKSKELPLPLVLDSVAPSIIFAYGIGRIGCHLSGDGCYGIPTSLPWATHYTNGVVSTLASKNPELVALFRDMYPGKIIPFDIAVHPTPIYELIYSMGIFALIMYLAKNKILPNGSLFGVMLVFMGIFRFIVESIRLNEKILFNLTQAQIVSIGMFVLGSIVMLYFHKKNLT